MTDISKLEPNDTTKIAMLECEIERLRAALRIFVGCSYPVAREINQRGHDWRGGDALDYALETANKALLSRE